MACHDKKEGAANFVEQAKPAWRGSLNSTEGKFMIQRSCGSGRYVFYFRVAEPLIGATDVILGMKETLA